MKTFRKELESLINKNSLENGSDTPDYILAEFLTGCLNAFDSAVNQRKFHTGEKDGQLENTGNVIGNKYSWVNFILTEIKMVRRDSWPENEVLINYIGKVCKYNRSTGIRSAYDPSNEDLDAQDWTQQK